MDDLKIRIQEEENITLDPNFWNDPKNAEKVSKSLNKKKNTVQQYEAVETLLDDAFVLFDFFKEGDIEESELNEAYDKA